MSANEMKKAYVTAVPFGSLTIEGLRDEQGNYYVATTQLRDAGLASQDNPSRDVKPLLGKEFQPVKFN